MKNQIFEVKVKNHLFSNSKIFSNRSVLFEPTMESLKLIVKEKYQCLNLNVISNICSGIFGLAWIISKN